MSEEEIIKECTELAQNEYHELANCWDEEYSSKAIQAILDLYKAEKEKNANIKEQMEKMNIADAGSLLAEFDRLECIEDEAEEIRLAYQNEKEKNKRLSKQLDLMRSIDLPKEIEKNYISIDKIKAKIEEYNKQRQKAETQKINDMFVNYIDVLQELLEEN